MTRLQDVITYGSTASRPAAGNASHIHLNSETGTIDFDTGSAWLSLDISVLESLLHVENHAWYGSDPLNIEDIENWAAARKVAMSDGNRGFFMGTVAKSLLSAGFAIDSTGVKTVTTAHGLTYAPSAKDVHLTINEDTNVDDFAVGYVKFESSDTTNIVAKVNVTTASGTGGATAKLGIQILVNQP